MDGIFKVVSAGELLTVKSEKAENGLLKKRNIVLRSLGGRHADRMLVTLLGNDAACTFYPDDVVGVSLHWQTREYNGQVYQDALVREIVKLN